MIIDFCHRITDNSQTIHRESQRNHRESQRIHRGSQRIHRGFTVLSQYYHRVKSMFFWVIVLFVEGSNCVSSSIISQAIFKLKMFCFAIKITWRKHGAYMEHRCMKIGVAMAVFWVWNMTKNWYLFYCFKHHLLSWKDNAKVQADLWLGWDIG